MMHFQNMTLIAVTFLNLVINNLWWIGLFNGAFLLAINAEKDSKFTIPLIILGFFSCLPILAFLIGQKFSNLSNIPDSASLPMIGLWVAAVLTSWVLTFWWLRVGVRKFNVLTDKLTVTTSLERNKKTDVREIFNHIPKVALRFDPLDYINKTKGVFLGLDENKQPTYIEFGGGTSAPHVEVVGTTGAGKGVSLGVMASQFLELGEAVFFCDPKDDEWAPSLMYDAANRLSKPYYYINLKRPNGPQFNLFDGASEDECFELFQAGFGLTEKGDASDFYGIEDRREAWVTAKIMAKENLTIAQVYEARKDVINDPDSEAKKFFGKLREMAEMPSINASSGGVSLEQIIQDGGCCYIVGSMRNDIVKTAQKILLVRIFQLAERRDRMAGEMRKICIVLDEGKYHISKVAIEGLSAARDKGVHIVLAHQSLGDLKDCSKDLNPEAVVDAVVENTKIKIAYRVMSPDTANWLAEMSGTILVDDESRNIRTNLLKAEIVEGDRTIRMAERFWVDTNMMLNLPPQVCVLYGSGLAKFVSIQPLKVPKSREAIRIIDCAGGAIKSAAEKLEGLEIIDDEKPSSSDFPMIA